MGDQPVNQPVTKAQIVNFALKDPNFKKELMADPKGTLKKYCGIDLGDDVKLTVLEEKPHDLYLVIPLVPYEDIEIPTPKGGFW